MAEVKEDPKKVLDPAPRDKLNFVYAIFCWLGIGTLLPWNFFISVSGYWDYKYRTVRTAATEDGLTVSDDYDPSKKNEIQTQWNSYLAVASMVPNVTFLMLNAIFGHRFRTQPRLLVSLCLVVVLFVFTTVMTKVDTDEWQKTFLIVTLASVVLINSNAAIFQGGLIGMAGKFPPKYMGGVFSGQALGGIFASVTNVIMMVIGATPYSSAFYCFLIAVVFLGTALASYAAITRSEFFHYYAGESHLMAMEEKQPEDKKLLDQVPAVKVVKKVNPLTVMRSIWPYALSVYLIFTVTLGCFPAITVLIVSVESGATWNDVYFVPVICFVLFNVGDYVGRFLAEWLQFPKPGKHGMVFVFVLSLLRFAFVPLFLYCNAAPGNRQVTQVLIESDVAYILIMIAFSVSNGYLTSVSMMSGPQLVPAEEQQTAGSLMVACIGLGLGTGALISNLFVRLL